MKIRTCAALLIALLAITLLAGCAVHAAEEKLDAVEDAVEHKLDTIEDAAEAAVIQAVTPEPAAQPAPAQTVPAQTSPAETAAPAVTEAAAQLTEEEATAIALSHAGLTAVQVQRLRAKYEIDDRVPQYDIEFREGRWEYEYEIHAETGAILSFEKDD